MANFPTHITTGALLGAAYGSAGHLGFDLSVPACVLAGGLCTIGGVLPDVDSDHAVILRESLALLAVVTPMLMIDRFRELGWTHETIFLCVALIYLMIRFGLGEVVRNPIHATGVGILLYARDKAERGADTAVRGGLREIWSRMKSWFQANN